MGRCAVIGLILRMCAPHISRPPSLTFECAPSAAQYRPRTLDEFSLHSEIASNLKNLVRYVALYDISGRGSLGQSFVDLAARRAA